MVTLQANYITKNNQLSFSPCTLSQNDLLNIRAEFLFALSEFTSSSGKRYKCEFKFVGPGTDPNGYSIYTDLKNVSSQRDIFISPTFPTPLPIGDYRIVWITLYDQYGNTQVAGLV